MANSWRKNPAPSTFAASFTSCGIAANPASRITVASGNVRQTWTIRTESLARSGKASQRLFVPYQSGPRGLPTPSNPTCRIT